ncbi:MAG: heme NO-binding domain-containing protein [Candidatus Hodarchaeales archaeon]
MKGVILNCLNKLVVEKFGKDNWEKILVDAGYNPNEIYLVSQDISDEKVFKIVGSTCKVLNISLSQAADAFGEYWMNSYAPKIYGAFFRRISSTKEFLKSISSVHYYMTKNLEHARPPKFTYDEPDDNTLIITYHSNRGLIDFVVGLARGVGTHFNENITVSKIDDKTVEVKFLQD